MRAWQPQSVLRVSPLSYSIRRRAQGADALAIVLALHEESTGIGKHVLQEWTQEKTENSQIALVSRKRAVRNASADEKYGNLLSPGFAQKIRPDLRLKHQHN